MWSQLEVGSLQAGIDLENRTQILSSMTGDMQEAMAAFLEKRPPALRHAAGSDARRHGPRILNHHAVALDGANGRAPPGYVGSSDAASPRPTRRRARRPTLVGRASVLVAGPPPRRLLGSGGGPSGRLANPPFGAPVPGLPRGCAHPSAPTPPAPCLRITLDAIDTARAGEGLRAHGAALRLPPSDRSRADLRRRRPRAGRPGTGAVRRVGHGARCATAQRAPRPPAAAATRAGLRLGRDGMDRRRRQRARCRLPVALRRRARTAACPGARGAGPRAAGPTARIVLGRFGSGRLVDGGRVRPDRRHVAGDRGGSSLAATFAGGASAEAGHFAYTWKEALAATAAGRLRPLRAIPSSESDTGIPDPGHNVAPVPDYTGTARSGARRLDGLHRRRARRHQPRARARRASGPWCCRRLRTVERSRAALRRRQPRAGATGGSRPSAASPPRSTGTRSRVRTTPTTRPTPGRPTCSTTRSGPAGRPTGSTPCTGGCTTTGSTAATSTACTGAAGCWGHRKGILDDFGSGANLVMGAAVNMRATRTVATAGGTSMAVTLAVADALPLKRSPTAGRRSGGHAAGRT